VTAERLAGKVALVTGGASGIGAAIVERFRLEGGLAYAADLSAVDGERAIRIDVTDEASVEAGFERVVREAGRLDVCVANAGVSPTIARAVDLDVKTWRHILDVNLTGVFLTLRAAARRMLARGRGGRLIATASVAAMAGEANGSAYCASKFGLRGLVESMALELADAEITVNAVAPGEVDTPLHAQLRALHADARTARTEERPGRPVARGTTAEDVRAELEGWIPARRFARPEEVAAAFAYLASDEAAYVTGTVLVVDGGQLLV
jgi:NAD(P)-dependent dehydrogenase (short-subunit alcohol dehydrogenase family)